MPFAFLLAALAEVPDPRRAQGQRYSMSHLLLFSVLATLAGATSYQKIIAFIALQRERLNVVFGACFRRTLAVNTLRHLFLAHQELAGAPDEIAAVPRLMAELGLTGVLFTADALHLPEGRTGLPRPPPPAMPCWFASRTTSPSCTRPWPGFVPPGAPSTAMKPWTAAATVARSTATSRCSTRTANWTHPGRRWSSASPECHA